MLLEKCPEITVFGLLISCFTKNYIQTMTLLGKCENIGWRYINNHSDAQRLYISVKKPFSNLFFANGLLSDMCCCLKCEWKISKVFFRSLEQFFLTVGQNNFGNKIPIFSFVMAFLDTVSVYPAPSSFKVLKRLYFPL